MGSVGNPGGRAGVNEFIGSRYCLFRVRAKRSLCKITGTLLIEFEPGVPLEVLARDWSVNLLFNGI